MRIAATLLLGTLAVATGHEVSMAAAPATRPATQPATVPATRPAGGSVLGDFAGARRIVILTDIFPASFGTIPMLRMELAKAVAGLKEGEQLFNVYCATNDDRRPFRFDARLVNPDAAGRKRFGQWLDDWTPTGTTDSFAAISWVFSHAPDRVLFVTDGEFNNIKTYDHIVDAYARFNRGKVRVDTLMIGSDDAEAIRALKRIAAAHNGSYRFVKRDEMGKD